MAAGKNHNFFFFFYKCCICFPANPTRQRSSLLPSSSLVDVSDKIMKWIPQQLICSVDGFRSFFASEESDKMKICGIV